MKFHNLFLWLRPDRSGTLASGAGSRQLRLAASAGFSLIAATALIGPYTGIKLDLAPGFQSAATTAIIMVSFMLTTLLLMTGTIEANGGSIRLGGAYLFTSLISLTALASFPGALVHKGLIGDPATPFWAYATHSHKTACQLST